MNFTQTTTGILSETMQDAGGEQTFFLNSYTARTSSEPLSFSPSAANRRRAKSEFISEIRPRGTIRIVANRHDRGDMDGYQMCPCEGHLYLPPVVVVLGTPSLSYSISTSSPVRCKASAKAAAPAASSISTASCPPSRMSIARRSASPLLKRPYSTNSPGSLSIADMFTNSVGLQPTIFTLGMCLSLL